MFAPFIQEEAQKHCKIIISLLNKNLLKLKQVSKISEERSDCGIMVASLVCRMPQKNTEIVLICVSGISKQLIYKKRKSSFKYNNTLYKIVPNIVSNKKIQKALNIANNDKKIHFLTDQINELSKEPINATQINKLQQLKNIRTSLCDASLKKVFSLYKFYTFNNTKITLNSIIKNHKTLPQTGTGDCCAPKLLSYAFKKKYIPLSMAEMYFGKDTKSKKDMTFYSPCDSRCAYILPSILGLEILYVDSDIIVVNKQSGLLSVPGRTKDKQDCIVNRVKKLFPFCISQPSVHRLDMETSGLLVLAFTKEAHKNLSIQFSQGLVKKEYIALLDGVLFKSKGLSSPKNNDVCGTMELKFRLDVNNRPHQIYDQENGKLGITNWQYIGTFTYTNPKTKKQKVVTKVKFLPSTGRTHQLRLASADIHGFALPIVGDTLYGKCEDGERLMLHASYISFTHPSTNKKMEFTCKPDFI